jgi:hypothetical protein
MICDTDAALFTLMYLSINLYKSVICYVVPFICGNLAFVVKF